jgi:hypothetical protein
MVKSTLLLPCTRRAAISLILACAMATGLSLFVVSRQSAITTARLHSAQLALEALTERAPEANGRAAIAWGYAERMRLGLQSPFFLIEAASRDPRLTPEEQRTVSWALLATLLRGESHQVDPAALDRISRVTDAPGESHLELIESSIRAAEDPRLAELALRFSYVLAASERVIDASGPAIVAQASALVADREIARREAGQLLRNSKGGSAVADIAEARRRRGLYVERPVLMTPPRSLEHKAIELVPTILAEIRTLAPSFTETAAMDSSAAQRSALFAAATRSPPSAEVHMIVKRFLPALRAAMPVTWIDQLARVQNPEMLASMLGENWARDQRRQLGRMQLAAGVAARTQAQAPVWFAGDVAPPAESLGIASISFDSDVPKAWRSQYVAAMAAGLRDLRQVFPALRLNEVNVRFRMTSPADSALAMHEPRTRMLHLPVWTAAGTLAHELAHDLDRQVSIQQGRPGYWSDAVARAPGSQGRGSAHRVAVSLRTLTEEISGGRAGRSAPDRPAEIFATRVDWFVAQALARQGISSGFLTAVQDEMLTGHVLHPERLRGADRSRSLMNALEGMTTITPAARAEPEPSAYSLMQYVLRTSLDRRSGRVASVGGMVTTMEGAFWCDATPPGTARLLRLAVLSRARGIVRGRAESIPADRRPIWAQEALGGGPWSGAAAAKRVESVASELLAQLTVPGLLQVGTGSRASTLLRTVHCAD